VGAYGVFENTHKDVHAASLEKPPADCYRVNKCRPVTNMAEVWRARRPDVKMLVRKQSKINGNSAV
jgi:hypothetical protein